MKALLNRNDFTKMVEIGQPLQVYEVLIDPAKFMSPDYARYATINAYAMVKYWIFGLAKIVEVDGKPVAIYEFIDER